MLVWDMLSVLRRNYGGYIETKQLIRSFCCVCK